jgi:hypothetical protein
VRLVDAFWLVGHQSVDRAVERVRVELHRRRGRQHERAGRRVERVVADAEVVAAVDLAVVEVDRAVVVLRVARRIDELERSAAEREAGAVLGDEHALRRDRHQLAVELPEERLAVDLDRAGDQLRGLDHVGRATRVEHRPGVRQRLDELARAPGVVEVHVRQEDVIDLLAGDADFVKRGEQARRGRCDARVDERRPPGVHHEVTRGQARPVIQGVDHVDTRAHGHGQPGVAGLDGGASHAWAWRGPGSSRQGCGLARPKTRRPGRPGLLSRSRTAGALRAPCTCRACGSRWSSTVPAAGSSSTSPAP